MASQSQPLSLPSPLAADGLASRAGGRGGRKDLLEGVYQLSLVHENPECSLPEASAPAGPLVWLPHSHQPCDGGLQNSSLRTKLLVTPSKVTNS